MTNRKISALVASVIAHTRGRITSRTVTHPTRDWWIGLVVAFGAAAVVIAWSASVYLEYKREGFLVNFEPPATAQIYRPELVASALTLMAERVEVRERLLSGLELVEDAAAAVETEATSSAVEAVMSQGDDVDIPTSDEFIATETDESNIININTTATSTAISPDESGSIVASPEEDIPILE